MPKVSVVIPTYNRAEYLPQCIESILGQSFRDFEVLLIDDGSTDTTLEAVSAYCPPVTYVRQENQGAPAAYNTGIRLARGPYVAFVDSDDVLLEGALQAGTDCLDQHPEVGFSHGRACAIDQRGHVIGFTRRPHCKGSCVRSGTDELKLLLLGNYVCHSSVMVRRSCFEVVGLYDPAFCRGSEDFDMWVRVAKRYAVAYIDKPLARFRIHDRSISSGREVAEIEWAHHQILRSVFDDQELGHAYRRVRRKAYSHLYLLLADIAISQHDVKAARRYLVRGFSAHPQLLPVLCAAGWPALWARAMLPSPLVKFARMVGLRGPVRTIEHA